MRKGGFTVIELLVVIGIIALLTLLSIIGLTKVRSRAKLAKVSTQLTDIAKAVTLYAEDNNYQYPPDSARNVPPGLERYLAGGTWPKSVWPHGVFDWDNWVHPTLGQQVYQITYRLCDTTDPVAYCSDSALFPNFTQYSGIYYCVSGPCIPHQTHPTDPGYCINCKVKQVNY